MKILVYGTGVLGSLMIHILCQSPDNEITVAATDRRRKTLQIHGMIVHHVLQRKTTVDYMRVVSPDDPAVQEEYDAVFSIMQFRQQDTLADTFRSLNAPLIVLVGNNPEAEIISRKITEGTDKHVLFGFESSAGTRKEYSTDCLRMSRKVLTFGGLHGCAQEDQDTIDQIFRDTGYTVRWCDDMDGWLKCHAAFILPVTFISYRYGCDRKKITSKDCADLMDAADEAYTALKAAGVKIRPESDESFIGNSRQKKIYAVIMTAVLRSYAGELACMIHCRNAYGEMEDICYSFEHLIADQLLSMPVWNRLRNEMPSYEEIRETYGK